VRHSAPRAASRGLQALNDVESWVPDAPNRSTSTANNFLSTIPAGRAALTAWNLPLSAPTSCDQPAHFPRPRVIVRPGMEHAGIVRALVAIPVLDAGMAPVFIRGAVILNYRAARRNGHGDAVVQSNTKDGGWNNGGRAIAVISQVLIVSARFSLANGVNWQLIRRRLIHI
jgi:hypothetical protein